MLFCRWTLCGLDIQIRAHVKGGRRGDSHNFKSLNLLVAKARSRNRITPCAAWNDTVVIYGMMEERSISNQPKMIVGCTVHDINVLLLYFWQNRCSSSCYSIKLHLLLPPETLGVTKSNSTGMKKDHNFKPGQTECFPTTSKRLSNMNCLLCSSSSLLGFSALLW